MFNQDQRQSSSARGYDRQWYRVRAMKLRANPLCEECLAVGRVKATEMVHHIIPITGKHDPLRLAMDNLMSLCMDCHAAKHSSESESKRLKGCDVNGFPIHPEHPWNAHG